MGLNRILTAIVGPVARLNIQVVRAPERLGDGRMTTSSSPLMSRSTSTDTCSAVARGWRTSRLIARFPVSIRLMVEGLRLVRAARSLSDRPRVLRRLRSRVLTTSSILASLIRDSLPLRILQQALRRHDSGRSIR